MPVGIDFYDELEMLISSRRACEIVFLKDGGRSVIHGIIADISDPGQNTFLKMDSGLEIRLADLIEVNGKGRSSLC